MMRCATRWPASTVCELEPDGLAVGADELERATVAPEVDAAIDDAIAHLRAFNEQVVERASDWSFEPEDGLTVGEKVTPISSAGLFVPSGKASYPSVAYQLGVPAVTAGVPEHRRSSCHPSPGGSGEVDPAVLVVCRKLGITSVFRVNGPGGDRRLGLRHRADPASAQGGRARFAGGRRLPRSRCSDTAWRR